MGRRGRNTRVEVSVWIFSSILSKSKLSLDCKIPLGFFPGGLKKMEPFKWMTFNLSHDKGAHILNKQALLSVFWRGAEIKLPLQCSSSNNDADDDRKTLSVKNAGNLYLAVTVNEYRAPASHHLPWSISVSEEKNTMAARDVQMQLQYSPTAGDAIEKLPLSGNGR